MIEHLHNKYSTFHSEESTCELDKSSSSCLIPRGSKKKKRKKKKNGILSFAASLTVYSQNSAIPFSK